MLGGAAAAEDRDPHSSLLLRFGRRGAACRRRSSPSSPGSSFGAGRRELVDRRGRPGSATSVSSSSTVGLSPASRTLRTASARSLPITFGTFACCFARGDDDRDGRARLRPRCRRSGDWLITSPAGEALSSSETLGVRPRPRICCTATRRWLPTRTGTLASFGPAGDDERDGRAVGRGAAAARVRSGSPGLLRPLSELTAFDLDFEAGGFELLRSPLPGCSRRSPGTLPLPGPALTVSVTFGFEQKKVRKEQSSSASSAGGEAAGPARAPSLAGASRSTRLTSPTEKPLLFEQGDRDVELVAGHVGDFGGGVAGQRQADQERRSGPRRPAAIQRRRRLRALLLGLLAAPPATATTGGSAAKAAVPPPAPGSFSAASRAAMKASALWKRSPGSFSSARITTASSAGETCGVDRARPLRRLRDLFHRHRDGAVGLEGDAAGQRLVEDHPDRVEVGDGGDVEALRLLGREVVRGAHHRAGLGDLRDAGAGDAEVGDDRLALAVDDHVLRLQVAVDDAVAVGEAGRPPAPGGSAPPPARA